MASGRLFHEFFEMSRIEQRRDGEGSKVHSDVRYGTSDPDNSCRVTNLS